MKDLLLTEDGDLYLSAETGDVTITDSVVQSIIIHLKWFLGEWRMNPDYGMPYYEDVFVKNPNTTLIKSKVRKELLSIEEVSSVEGVEVSVNNATRRASITFSVTLKDGSDVTKEVRI